MPFARLKNTVSKTIQTNNMATNKEQDKKDILQLVEKMQNSWREHDAKAYASSFSEDATFTTVFGNINEGRQAIEEGHALVFSRLFKQSTLTITDTSVRFIRPGVASVQIRWKMTGATHPDGTPWKDRKGLMDWIVVNQNHRWEVVVAHNSELAEPAPGFAKMLGNTA
jgi:uncharacterized protein (TIGR02246 family)